MKYLKSYQESINESTTYDDLLEKEILDIEKKICTIIRAFGKTSKAFGISTGIEINETFEYQLLYTRVINEIVLADKGCLVLYGKNFGSEYIDSMFPTDRDVNLIFAKWLYNLLLERYPETKSESFWRRQKYNFFGIVNESSSLSKLGIPKNVMQLIQRDYEISTDAKWERLPSKFEVKDVLLEKKKNLLLELSIDYIKIISSDFNGDKNIYSVERFSHDEEAQWGGTYNRTDRTEGSFTETFNSISQKNLIFKLKEGEFQVQPYNKRKFKKESIEFDMFTLEFKIRLVKDFNEIVKKMYGNMSSRIVKTILDNVASMPEKIGTASVDEMIKLINDNAALKEMSDDYQKMKNENDILGLEKLEKQFNSLTIFDEYLIEFEVLYSEEFNLHLTISDLVKDFGWDKIKTAFMYYLYTGKMLPLRIQQRK